MMAINSILGNALVKDTFSIVASEKKVPDAWSIEYKQLNAKLGTKYSPEIHLRAIL